MARVKSPVTVEGLYYSHGLFCASYPGTVIAFVALAVIMCSLPFFITSSGGLNTPKPWRSPWLNYRVPSGGREGEGGSGEEGEDWLISNITQFSKRTPSWFVGLPVAVIQQLYVTMETNCGALGELCRKSYYSSSRIAASYLQERMREAAGVCDPVVHPALLKFLQSLSNEEGSPLPLPATVLSPALDSVRDWGNSKDSLSYQSVKELLYGGFWQYGHPFHTSDFPLSTKTHVFAITFMLEATRERFPGLTSCVQAVRSLWPDPTPSDLQSRFMKHFYYEPGWHLTDFAPLMGVYIIVFLYISFSVGKIDLVKSKAGLGFTACITVVASLTMSLGICTFFGLSISLSGSEIYPFMVVIIGLENILIIVKAVMSTPEELEVKYRIAAGLAKEGQAITQSLLSLLFILTMGIIFFNYTLKEFCIITLVGLLCDAFLQLVFFPTVLSIDLRRLELSDLSSTLVDALHTGETPSDQFKCPCPTSLATPKRWRSRRVRFAYFLANARFVSRAMTVVILGYLVARFVSSETFLQMVGVDNTSQGGGAHPEGVFPHDSLLMKGQLAEDLAAMQVPLPQANKQGSPLANDSLGRVPFWHSFFPKEKTQLFHSGVEGFGVTCEGGEVCWRPMVTTHWPKLLHRYGYDTESRFLTVLPPITLNLQLGFEFPRQPQDHTSLYHAVLKLLSHPYTKRGSLVLTWVGTITVYFAALIRSSLKRRQQHQKKSRHSSTRVGFLKGHQQDIECLCVEHGLVVSASLDGDLKVWDLDPMRRRCLHTIQRGEICGDLPESGATLQPRPAAEGCESKAEAQSMGGANTPQLPPRVQPARQPNSFDTAHSRRSSVPSPPVRHLSLPEYPHTSAPLSPLETTPLPPAPSSPPPLPTNLLARRLSESSLWYPRMQNASVLPPAHHSPRLRNQTVQNGGMLRRAPSGCSLHGMATTLNPGNPHQVANTTASQQFPSTTSMPQTPSLTGLHQTPSSTGLHQTPSLTGLHQTPSLTGLHQTPSSTGLHQTPSSTGLHQTPSSTGLHQTPSSTGLHQIPSSTSLQGYASPSSIQPSLPVPFTYPPPRSNGIHTTTPYPSLPSSSHLQSVTTTIASSMMTHVPAEPQATQTITQSLSSSQVANGSHSTSFLRPGHTRNHSATIFSRPTHSRNSSLGNISSQAENGSHSTSFLRPGHTRNLSATIFSRPTHSRNSSLGNISSQAENGSHSTSFLRPGHTRNHSATIFSRPTHSRNSSLGNISLGNLSLMSNQSTISESGFSTNSAFVMDSSATQQTNPDEGYNFERYFDLFSQFTSNMALEYCTPRSKGTPEITAPPIWCMDVWNDVIAVGCGSGQIEAWNLSTGSLIFCLSMNLSGVAAIAVNSHGVITGHMDGSLHLIGHNGLPQHCIQAHSHPISVMKCTVGKVVTGSYDTAVKVHRIQDFFCLNSVFIHSGSISTLALLEGQGCVSGCSRGLVCHWELTSGRCVHEFEEYGSAVVRLESFQGCIIALFADDCIRVWESSTGYLLHTILLDEMCHGFVTLGTKYMAVCLELTLVLYDIETGLKHSEKAVELPDRGTALVRHVEALDEAHVLCGIGQDLLVIPCEIKLKSD